MKAGSNIEQALVAQFLDVYLEDQERGSVRSDEAYLKLFPGAHEAVCDELRALRREGDAEGPAKAEDSQTSGLFETSGTHVAPDIAARLQADRGAGVERTLFEYLALFPGREREVATALGQVRRELAGVGGEVPTTLGPYRLERELGRGGQATVYLAQDDKLDRKIALKVFVTSSLLPNSSTRQRFEREALITARLDHPNLCAIHEVGEEGPFAYIAMPYIEGEALSTKLARQARGGRPHQVLELARDLGEAGTDALGTPRAAVMRIVALLEELARAVHVANEAGVLHRDIKPSNVLVTPDGRPVLLDFGLARAPDDEEGPCLTQTGDILGTPRYMSPEQVSGDGVPFDRRTDVYSLAVTLFECLTGRTPFESRNLQALYRQVLTQAPAYARSLQPAVPEDLDVVLQVALEKDPRRRFASALELADDLGRLRRNEPIRATSASTAYQVRKFAQRHRGLVAGALATVLSLILGTVVAVEFALRSQAAEELAAASEAESKRLTYRTLLRNSKIAVAAGDNFAAISALEETDEALRGWEWFHQRAQLPETLAVVDTGTDFMPAIGFDQGGRALTVLTHDSAEERSEIVDLESGQPLSRLGPAASSYWFSGDAKHVAAFFRNDNAVVYDVASGSELVSIPMPNFDAKGVMGALLTSSTLVVTIDRSMRVFDLPSGTPRFRRVPEGDLIDAPNGMLHISGPIAMSANGDTIAHIFRNEGEATFLELLDGESGQVLARRELPGRYPHAVSFSPDGRIVAIAANELQQFTTPELTPTGAIEHGGIETFNTWRGELSFDATGQLLTLAQANPRVITFDAATGRFRSNLRAVFPVNGVLLDASAERALLASIQSGEAHDVQLLALGLPAVRVLGEHSTYVYATAFSPAGTLLATGDFDGVVRIWDPMGGEMIAELGERRATNAVQQLWFTNDGAGLVVRGRYDETPTVWNLRTGSEQRVELSAAPRPRAGALLSNAAADPKLVGEPVFLAAGGTFEVVGRRSGSVVVSDVATGNERISFEAHGGKLYALAVSPDGRWIATGGSEDGSVGLWSATTGEQLASIRLEEVGTAVYSLAFNPDGSRLAAGGKGGTLHLLDTSTFKLAMQLEGHRAYVHGLAFSPDGALLASASGDRSVRVWDTVSAYRRGQQAQAAAKRRDALRPRVEQAFEDMGDVTAVAAHLMEGASTEEERAAFQRLLIERAFGR